MICLIIEGGDMGIWLSSADIQKIMGCKSTKAASILRRCNEFVKLKKPGAILPGRGKCYLKAFCQLTGATKEEVKEVLADGVHG